MLSNCLAWSRRRRYLMAWALSFRNPIRIGSLRLPLQQELPMFGSNAHGATTTYDINEILYPSATTANANDAPQVEFGNYVSFLASDMASRGISGEIEIWNEPPWIDDSWDARGYLYDSFPAGAVYSPNFGFA